MLIIVFEITFIILTSCKYDSSIAVQHVVFVVTLFDLTIVVDEAAEATR